MEDGLDSSIVVGAAIDGIGSATNGSIEKRTLQGLLLSSLSIEEVMRVFPSMCVSPEHLPSIDDVSLALSTKSNCQETEVPS